MPTLYDQAESNIHKTWLLITFFAVLLIGIGWVLSELYHNFAILIIAVIFSVFTSFYSYWYSDRLVIRSTGARPIEKKDNPELYRVVENLCITAGIPMPKIYIIPSQQPNAFATGRDEKHAAVVVTQGLLDKLERVELEGVLSHEISHIRNKDILLGTVVAALVGAIIMVSDIALRVSFWGGFGEDSDSGRGGGWIIIVLGILAIILAPIGATLLQLAISRKREFLADASGALLTRYPEGLARALEKISTDQAPMKRVGNSTAHLFIVSPLKGKQARGWFAKLFMTHPPVEERIEALRGMKI